MKDFIFTNLTMEELNTMISSNKSILLLGNPATGKTTFINKVLSKHIPKSKKMLYMVNSKEMKLSDFFEENEKVIKKRYLCLEGFDSQKNIQDISNYPKEYPLIVSSCPVKNKIEQLTEGHTSPFDCLKDNKNDSEIELYGEFMERFDYVFIFKRVDEVITIEKITILYNLWR